jgi:hypothetical protein
MRNVTDKDPMARLGFIEELRYFALAPPSMIMA